MAMDVGTHWHLDDATTIINPTILGMAAEINLGAFEGIIWNRLGPPSIEKVNDYRYEIYDRSRTALSGVIGDGAATGWVDSSTKNDLPMTQAACAVLTVGDVLEVGSEQVIVKSVDRTAYTIDVFDRGHGGTTAAAHADQVSFTVIGTAINDTDLKNVESFAEQSGKYTNYTQTFVELIEQTFTDEISARKAFEQKPQLIKEAMDRMFRKLCKTSIKGRQAVGTKSIPQTTSGILHQLSNGGGVRSPLRLDATGYTSIEKVLKDSLSTVWNAGGNPTHIYINPTNKRKADALTQQFIRMSRGEATQVGTDNAESFMYQGRVLQFVQDQDMPTDRIELVTESSLEKGWRVGDVLRGPILEPLKSSRELRYSMQGTMYINVRGVGVQHIDVYNLSL